MTELLTSADAARVLGLTPAAVRLAAKSGRLKIAQTTVGGVRLFKRTDVERFKREREERAAVLAS